MSMNLVMVTSDGTFNNSYDGDKKTTFEGWGWTVVGLNSAGDQDAYDTAAGANDLMYISESCVSSTVGGKATGLDIGIVAEESWVWDDLLMVSDTPAADPNVDTIVITDGSHYITNTLGTGTFELYVGVNQISYNTNSPNQFGAGVTLLAYIDGESSHYALFCYDTGATLYDTSSAVNRLVTTPTHWFPDPDTWEANGDTIMERSLIWAASQDPPAGWTGIVDGVTNPAKVIGVEAANIASVIGVT